MSIPEGIASEQRSLEHITGSTYIVRHDNTFDNPSTWAFTDFAEAAKLRDTLNAEGTGPDGSYHVEEEPHYTSAAEVLDELRQEGWFDE